MKAAIIGASQEALHTIEKAHKYGITLIALDGNPEAVGLKAADKKILVDISDEDATIEALRKENPNFVLTAPIGRYLTTTGAVNDALGLPGISKEMAVLCTDKFRFHKKLNEKGLRKCHCYAVDGQIITYGNKKVVLGKSAESNEMQLCFPAILKPRYGSGSRGIFMPADSGQLKNFLELIEKEPYVLEECVLGEEYGVDGAVTKEGFHMVLLRKKKNTPPPARQAVGYFSVQPSEAFWQQVHDYMAEVIECLGLKECLFHADVIKSAGTPFAIEVSARPSGHNLHNLFTPLCTGIDMAEEYIRYRIGLPYSFVPGDTKSMMIHYFDMQGKVAYIPDQKSVERAINAKLLEWKCHMEVEEELKPVSDGHSIMERGYYVLEDKKEADLAIQADTIKNLFSIHSSF